MIAIIWCKDEELATFLAQEQPIPRIGEKIAVEREERKTYRVEEVLWLYRFLTNDILRPLTDHRIEIHVSEVADD